MCWSKSIPIRFFKLPEDAHVEGGDVMLHNDYLFVGTYYGSDYSNFITARTNIKAVEYLREMFPEKKLKSFNLKKSNYEPRDNALAPGLLFSACGKGQGYLV